MKIQKFKEQHTINFIDVEVNGRIISGLFEINVVNITGCKHFTSKVLTNGHTSKEENSIIEEKLYLNSEIKKIIKPITKITNHENEQ
jgi:hypothetical protein